MKYLIYARIPETSKISGKISRGAERYHMLNESDASTKLSRPVQKHAVFTVVQFEMVRKKYLA
jgi:hypothetical protein